MKDYQRAAWGEGMADKVVRFAMDAVIGGDVALVGDRQFVSCIVAE